MKSENNLSLGVIWLEDRQSVADEFDTYPLQQVRPRGQQVQPQSVISFIYSIIVHLNGYLLI